MHLLIINLFNILFLFQLHFLYSSTLSCYEKYYHTHTEVIVNPTVSLIEEGPTVSMSNFSRVKYNHEKPASVVPPQPHFECTAPGKSLSVRVASSTGRGSPLQMHRLLL